MQTKKVVNVTIFLLFQRQQLSRITLIMIITGESSAGSMRRRDMERFPYC